MPPEIIKTQIEKRSETTAQLAYSAVKYVATEKATADQNIHIVETEEKEEVQLSGSIFAQQYLNWHINKICNIYVLFNYMSYVPPALKVVASYQDLKTKET